MKLRLLAVGKLRDAWVQEGCGEYLQRLQRALPIETVEVKTQAELVARLPKRARIVVLDERGREPTSRELSHQLGAWMNRGTDVVLVIGGADGVPTEVKERADETIALSRLTLPHRLARLLLLEQLYRALSILRGDPYHRE